MLQPTSQWVPPAKLESILNDLTISDRSEVHTEEKNDNTKIEMSNQEEENEQENVKHRSVSTIVQELQRDLERPFVEVTVFFKRLDCLYTAGAKVCGHF